MKKKKLFNIHVKWYHVAFALFLVGIVLGALYANLFLVNSAEQYSTVYGLVISKMKESEVRKSELFQFVVVNRLKFFIVLWGIGFIMFANYINKIFIAYLGFCLGMLLSIAYIAEGIKGYLFVVLLHIPHYLIYVPIFLYLLNSNQKFSNQLYKNKIHGKHVKLNGQAVLEYSLILCIVILLTILGAFFESYLNLEVLKWYR